MEFFDFSGTENASKLINFYSSRNHQKTFDHLMISGEIEVS